MATPTTQMTNVNNLPAMVPVEADPSAAGAAPPRRHWLRRWWWVLVLAVIGLVTSTVVVVSLLIHENVVLISPGETESVNKLITVPADQNHPTKDRVDLVTVSVNDDVTLFDKVRAEHDSDVDIEPAQAVLGGQTPQENDELNQVLMRQSKDSAVVVAMSKLGYNVQPTQTGALIDDIVHGAPADGVLNIGDTIVAIDGQPITSADALHQALATHKPGDTITVTVENSSNARRDATITLTDNPNQHGVGFIGIGPEDRLSYPSLPFNVSIDSQQIGGPSAGLAFTLGVLDELTPGDLTGGHEIAATGTIDDDGTVGQIGGIEQKVVTV